MAEYISREDAIDKIRSLQSRFRAKNDWDSGYDTAIAEAFEHIKRVPVADVQPVRYGQWIECCNELDKKCSCCDKVHGTIYEREPFCPNCGARMMKEGDANG